MTAIDALKDYDVSRETLERLTEFAALLEKWNPKINLVSKATLPDLWHRHILDSAQLYPFLQGASKIVDIGTGGGFPGLILAIMTQDASAVHVTMVESDKRKCAFLQTAITQLGLRASVQAERVEAIEPMQADIMTSRALASLDNLLMYAASHLRGGGRALFLKGALADAEINEALASWRFDLQKKTSKTSADAVVLELSNIRQR